MEEEVGMKNSLRVPLTNTFVGKDPTEDTENRLREVQRLLCGQWVQERSGFVGGGGGSVGGGTIGDGAGESGSQEGGENDGLKIQFEISYTK